MESPRYEHPCPNCVFVCRLPGGDGYFCEGPHYYPNTAGGPLMQYADRNFAPFACDPVPTTPTSPVSRPIK